MLKKQLLLKDPLKFLGNKTQNSLPDPFFGAVIARAGVGKTAFLVQIAISSLLNGKPVLHISIKDPVEKVNLWYKEMFQNITKPYNAQEGNRLWEELLAHRFIMTFETEGFDFKKMNNRVMELKNQNIFIPQTIIIDGALFDRSLFPDLLEMKSLARANRETIWFSMRTHRHEAIDPLILLQPSEGVPGSLFDIVLQITPEKDRLRIKSVTTENKFSNDQPLLFLNPSTMLIQEN